MIKWLLDPGRLTPGSLAVAAAFALVTAGGLLVQGVDGWPWGFWLAAIPFVVGVLQLARLWTALVRRRAAHGNS